MTAPDEWAATSIADAIARLYAARLAIPPTTAGQMGVVQARYGSNRASARAAGVDERSWRRWLAGTTRPNAASARKLAETAGNVRAAGIRPNFQRVDFVQRMGRRHRDRSADVRGLNYNRAADDQVADAVRRRDWGAAARAWHGGIRDAEYRRMFGPGEYLDAEYGITVTGMVM